MILYFIKGLFDNIGGYKGLIYLLGPLHIIMQELLTLFFYDIGHTLRPFFEKGKKVARGPLTFALVAKAHV